MAAHAPPRLHVALVEPEIHWNTGNAGRTCLANGARLHLIEPLGFSLTERAVRRAGLDYWPRVMPCVWPDWAGFERSLPTLGEPLLITPDADRPLWEAAMPEGTVLIFGRETSGLAPEIRRRYSDRAAHIPQPGRGVRSLNLSTCVGIAVYEYQRRRALTRR